MADKPTLRNMTPEEKKRLPYVRDASDPLAWREEPSVEEDETTWDVLGAVVPGALAAKRFAGKLARRVAGSESAKAAEIAAREAPPQVQRVFDAVDDIPPGGRRAYYGKVRTSKEGDLEKLPSGKWSPIPVDKSVHGEFNPKRPTQSVFKRYYKAENTGADVPKAIEWWMKYRAKPYDTDKPIKAKLKDLVPYREYSWTKNRNRNGPEAWEELKKSMAKGGWNENSPLQLVVDRKDKRVYIGEGNHRLAIARELFGDDYEVPVRIVGQE